MNESYFELVVSSNINSQILSDFILSFVDAVEQNQNSIIIRSETDLTNLEFAIHQFAIVLEKKLQQNITIDTQVEKKESIDWIKKYQSSVPSIEVGRFFIHPSWQESRESFINITMDPSFAFGTGNHASTNSCLILIDKYIKDNHSMIDVGCGSGILAIAAAKIGAIVDICDTDEIALVNAEENFNTNSVKYRSSWIGSAYNATKKYDVVVANIVADILIFLSNDLKSLMNDSGFLIISGIIDKQRKKVLKKYEDMRLIQEIIKDEWTTLIYKGY